MEAKPKLFNWNFLGCKWHKFFIHIYALIMWSSPISSKMKEYQRNAKVRILCSFLFLVYADPISVNCIKLIIETNITPVILYKNGFIALNWQMIHGEELLMRNKNKDLRREELRKTGDAICSLKRGIRRGCSERKGKEGSLCSWENREENHPSVSLVSRRGWLAPGRYQTLLSLLPLE